MNSFHYRSFEESLAGIDSIWTLFVNVLEKSEFLIFWQKLGGQLTRGGGGQPFSDRNSLTDHKKTSDVPLDQIYRHMQPAQENGLVTLNWLIKLTTYKKNYIKLRCILTRIYTFLFEMFLANTQGSSINLLLKCLINNSVLENLTDELWPPFFQIFFTHRSIFTCRRSLEYANSFMSSISTTAINGAVCSRHFVETRQ